MEINGGSTRRRRAGWRSEPGTRCGSSFRSKPPRRNRSGAHPPESGRPSPREAAPRSSSPPRTHPSHLRYSDARRLRRSSTSPAGRTRGIARAEPGRLRLAPSGQFGSPGGGRRTKTGTRDPYFAASTRMASSSTARRGSSAVAHSRSISSSAGSSWWQWPTPSPHAEHSGASHSQHHHTKSSTGAEHRPQLFTPEFYPLTLTAQVFSITDRAPAALRPAATAP